MPGPAGSPFAPMSTSSQPRSFVPASVTVRKQWLTPSLPVGWQQAARIRTGLPLVVARLLYASRQVVPNFVQEVGVAEDAGADGTVETLEVTGGAAEWWPRVASTTTRTATPTQTTTSAAIGFQP